MKRIFALALSLVVVIFALPPATVYVANRETVTTIMKRIHSQAISVPNVARYAPTLTLHMNCLLLFAKKLQWPGKSRGRPQRWSSSTIGGQKSRSLHGFGTNTIICG